MMKEPAPRAQRVLWVLSYLKTHWTPGEAHTILSFLDDVRDTLWRTYGSEIIEHYQQQQAQNQHQDKQVLVDWEDDPIAF